MPLFSILYAILEKVSATNKKPIYAGIQSNRINGASSNFIMNNQKRRQELSLFLKQRRGRITPEAVGLPRGSRRRTPGLRREEVAQLAGVGVTWYTWLEQGRDISVSAQVIKSIARVLRLSAVERTYLFELVRQTLPLVQTESATRIDSSLQFVLDNQSFCPAYIMGWRWDILAWNQTACMILMDFNELPLDERNILWLMFMNNQFRAKLPNWNVVCQKTIAHFRATCSSYVDNPEFTDLIERLKSNSPEFKKYWDKCDVLHKHNSLKEFNHPVLGQLKFVMTMFELYDPLNAKLILFVPDPNSSTKQKLKKYSCK